MSNPRYSAGPAQPEERFCEFCDKRATAAFTLEAGKLYVYACSDHLTLGMQAAGPKKAAPRRKSIPESDRLFRPPEAA